MNFITCLIACSARNEVQPKTEVESHLSSDAKARTQPFSTENNK